MLDNAVVVLVSPVTVNVFVVPTVSAPESVSVVGDPEDVGLLVKLPLIVGTVPIVYVALAESIGEKVRLFMVMALPKMDVILPLPFTTKFALDVLHVPVLLVSGPAPVPVRVIVEPFAVKVEPPLVLAEIEPAVTL